MDNYKVILYARAYRDIDNIYAYIAENLSAPNTAEKMIETFEKAIFSLESFPERGAIRKTGIYANQYRQLLEKNFVIIYKVLKKNKEVHIITVRYAPSKF